MKNNILKLTALILSLFAAISCSDVIGLDDNINKKMTNLEKLRDDSLSKFIFYNIDFGVVGKFETSSSGSGLYNNSSSDTITIYSINFKNSDGVFFYQFPEDAFTTNPPQITHPVLPYILYPKTGLNIAVTFPRNTNDNYVAGTYYDTLFINNSTKYYIKIEGTYTP